MKAVDTKLLALLKVSTQFVVPIYQRVYSWQESECAQLWSDIVRAGANEKLGAHFTGSIVYVAKDEGTNTSAEPDLIIDGQQRVTTVTLLLAALAKKLEGLPEGAREPMDGFSPRKIRNRYLFRKVGDTSRRSGPAYNIGGSDYASAIEYIAPRCRTWRSGRSGRSPSDYGAGPCARQIGSSSACAAKCPSAKVVRGKRVSA